MKASASNLTKLALLYQVHVNTLKKWLKDCPELNLDKRRRTLTPKQVKAIYDLLGEP
jgi:hypothetical protein